MDPLSVIKTLWRHKFILFPVLLVTVVAAVYIFAFGPRSYQATATFALVNPLIPSERDILQDPALGTLNSNNPYLRSSDNTLIAQVLTTRLNSPEVAKSLQMLDLDADYTVERAGGFGTGLLIQTTATGSSPEQAMDTVQVLGEFLVQELDAMQKVNGADQRFLFTALAVTLGDQATEQFSSRLRSVILVGAGGVILLFAAISAAQALDRRRDGEERRNTEPPPSGPGTPSEAMQGKGARQLRNDRRKDLQKRRSKISV